MLKEITYKEYSELYQKALEFNSDRVRSNLTFNEFDKDAIYLRSGEGCSILYKDGLLGGLFRFKAGDEDLISIHQDYRISLGGYFLECFDGKLVKLYSKQGFKVIARIAFNPEFAPEGWQDDEVLKHRPDVVFMALKPNTEIKTFGSYEEAYDYAQQTTNPKKYRIRKYVPQRDAFFADVSSLKGGLRALDEDLNNLHNVITTEVRKFITFNGTKNYIIIDL